MPSLKSFLLQSNWMIFESVITSRWICWVKRSCILGRHYTNLQGYSISTRFDGIPESIGQLYGMRDLCINGLSLGRLPATMEWLYNLRTLDVRSNNLSVCSFDRYSMIGIWISCCLVKIMVDFIRLIWWHHRFCCLLSLIRLAFKLFCLQLIGYNRKYK